MEGFGFTCNTTYSARVWPGKSEGESKSKRFCEVEEQMSHRVTEHTDGTYLSIERVHRRWHELHADPLDDASVRGRQAWRTRKIRMGALPPLLRQTYDRPESKTQV